MAFPPRPAPLTTDPYGKSGIAEHLVENARRASERARGEADLMLAQRMVQLAALFVDKRAARSSSAAGPAGA